MKTCTKCMQTKAYSEFKYKPNSKYKDGYLSSCRSCENARMRVWRAANVEKARLQGRIDYAKNASKRRQKSRGGRFRKKYWPHLTGAQALVEWNRLYEAQGGKCSVCKREKPLDVEHDHVTGKVRSLACNGCNTAVARVEENLDIALAVAKYIQDHTGAL